MKAVFITGHGGPDVLQFGDQPDPVAKPGEVVVDIVAASVNGADWKVRAGKSNPLSQFPHILGRDFSGLVSAVGAGVTDLRVGEKIAIKAAIVCKKPDSISHESAAALALAGLTAICAVEDSLQLKAGETILVQGGAGGVASFAIQLAKHLGARVISTASAANVDYVKSIGADQVIDYNAVDFTTAVRDCDAVFDTVGGEVAQRSYAVLKPGGRATFIASGPKPPKPDRNDVVALRPSVGRDRPHLERIVELVQAGAIREPDMTFYRLADAIAAHKVSESRHFKGKLVFKIS
jgi:NADPH:quinone reductase-like Zn-dependent oxidoreductase